ncbi:MAG TPA: M67 family metallopeptidase [Abditibacteriaceae bacterium]|jgi:proteasome lid subunit RPN8/RPN11
MLKISQDQYERIVAQGREGKPLEICGLLAGRRDGDTAIVADVYPITSDDQSPLTYTLNAAEHFKAEKDIRARGLETVGIYHTHPATVAYPSVTDVARAHWGEWDDLLYPGISFLIVSLRNPETPEPHSFHINGRRIPEDIIEEPVEIL